MSNEIDIPSVFRFLAAHAKLLPVAYGAAISQHVTLIYFILSALEVLACGDAFDKECPAALRQLLPHAFTDQAQSSGKETSGADPCGKNKVDGPAELIEYLYSCQHREGGFCASPWIPTADMASCYSAIASLVILGDSLERVNRQSISRFMQSAVARDGGYQQYRSAAPALCSDPRFTFCAIVVTNLLGINLVSPREDVVNSLMKKLNNGCGGFGASEGSEAHGGYTYCCVASLTLLDALPQGETRERLLRWCVMRMDANGGFSGRPGKPVDSCYSYWIGASIKLLGGFDGDGDAHGASGAARSLSVISKQQSGSGFARDEESYPDLLHNYMSLAALSVLGGQREGPRRLNTIDARYNMSERAVQRRAA